MPIAGPNIGFPSVAEPMFTLDLERQSLALTYEWGAFFSQVNQLLFNMSRSGPTASRPTETLPSRWIGMPYYDSTLGLPVFLHSTNPDVWHNGAGAAV